MNELWKRVSMQQIEEFCDLFTNDNNFCDYRYSIPVEWDGNDIFDYPIFETLLLIEKDQSIISCLKVDDGMYMVVNIYDEDNNFNL